VPAKKSMNRFAVYGRHLGAGNGVPIESRVLDAYRAGIGFSPSRIDDS
jgi:hypothetical protein